MTLALLAVAALAVVLGYARAIGRCRVTVREGKAAARARAAAALQADRASQAWDADTARLHAVLDPLLTDPAPATGFGDALVAEERLRVALASLQPVEEYPL